MKTAFVHHPIALRHDTGPGHPETAKRYDSIMTAMRAAPVWELLVEIVPDKASQGLIQAAHTKEHFKRVAGAFESGLEFLDADTAVSMQSFDAALFAAGGVCRAIDSVIGGESRNAFVAARPPGHHATAESAMGFCLFNNVAVGARYAQNRYKEVERVAIVDWDVHHGNGTQGIFFDDPSVHFFSIHQYPWYPGSGSRGETGFGRGRGYTLNVPVKAHASSADQRRMFEAAIGSISSSFKPDLVIISAGFDAHLTDPLGQLKLEDEDFASMTRTVLDWAAEACAGRVVSVLEGGYNLRTLGQTVARHISALSEG
jgi:acetoin utilization deacetylase AcuC-like enzyme